MNADSISTLIPKNPAKSPPRDIRVAVLFQRFGPYHHARLNAAGRLMSVWGVESCAMEDTYAWAKVEGAKSFTRVTLTDRDSGDREWRRQLQKKMWDALDEIKPQVVVVPGWSYADALSALLWCAENTTPSIVMTESTDWDSPRVASREWIKGRLVRLNSAALAGGTPHEDYLSQLGLPRDRVFLGYDVVDNDYFRMESDRARQQAQELRRHHGLPERYFLASARFVEKKNLLRLIQAYGRYRDLMAKSRTGKSESQVWDLVLLGDGPLRSSIFELRAALGLEGCLHLPGFKQYDELPAYFGLASAFVHASTTEQWGLVVNEAMASRLPVLVSYRCGCAENLVVPGVNGYQFDPLNVDEMARLLAKLATGEASLAEFGEASRRIVADWGPERFATGLRDAVSTAIKQPAPRVGLADRMLLRMLLSR